MQHACFYDFLDEGFMVNHKVVAKEHFILNSATQNSNLSKNKQ